MQQLEFSELDDLGRLVLVDDAGTRYAVVPDDRLRAALRPRPVRSSGQETTRSVSPRDIQAMIRAGQSAQEVATATGWELVRVQRFEGPVVAEREHLVGLAQAAHVRAQGRTDGSHTLDRRVRERLSSRGVDPGQISWDAARSEAHGPWTVVVIFEAGGRERRAAWHYDVQDRSIEALDDEARWLSEDEQSLPGGLAGHPLLGASTAEDETNELMATMRARRQRRARRPRKGETEDAAEPPASESGSGSRAGGQLVDEVLPIEDLAFDEATMGTPPAAHPRGSAAESPTPIAAVARVEDRPLLDEADEDEPAEEESTEDDSPVEGIYARTRHDPAEVSFDEFFGLDEDEDEEESDDYTVEDFDEDDLEELDEDEAASDAADDSDAEVVATEDDVVEDDSAEAEGVAEVQGNDTDEVSAPEPPADPEPEPEPAPEPKPSSTSRRKGRPSVPSWDDIMFGGGTKRD